MAMARCGRRTRPFPCRPCPAAAPSSRPGRHRTVTSEPVGRYPLPQQPHQPLQQRPIDMIAKDWVIGDQAPAATSTRSVPKPAASPTNRPHIINSVWPSFSATRRSITMT